MSTNKIGQYLALLRQLEGKWFCFRVEYIFLTRNISAVKKEYDDAKTELHKKEAVLRSLFTNYSQWYDKTLQLKQVAETLIAAHEGGEYYRKCFYFNDSAQHFH